MRDHLRRRSVALAACLAAPVLGATGAARAVVVPGGFTPPAQSYIGAWNGASGVAVGERWVLTARHVGGGVGQTFVMNDQAFVAAHVFPSPRADLALIHLADPLPGWYELGPAPIVGQRVLLGGHGLVAGPARADGFDWAGPTQEAWGANTVESARTSISVRFDAPGTDGAIDGEAIFALYDSGGGLFTVSDDNQSLHLVGIATGLSGPLGSSLFGSYAYALSLDSFQPWLSAFIHPGVPITSSLPPPGSFFNRPRGVPAPGAVITLGVAVLLVARRRR
jgi:hypothetical protein